MKMKSENENLKMKKRSEKKRKELRKEELRKVS